MKTLTFLLISTMLYLNANAGGGSSIGPANPASVTCERLGGGWRILEDAGQNQWGFCQFGNAVIEQWTLYRHRTESASLATKAFLRADSTPMNPSLPNPADRKCGFLGGQVKRWSGSLGYPTTSPVILCQFYDGSIVDAWALVRGPKVDRELTNALTGSRLR